MTRPVALRDRVAIHANVRPSSKACLDDFCDISGISVNSFIEAHLVDLGARITANDGVMKGVLEDIVDCARAIDATRRKRERREHRGAA